MCFTAPPGRKNSTPHPCWYDERCVLQHFSVKIVPTAILSSADLYHLFPPLSPNQCTDHALLSLHPSPCFHHLGFPRPLTPCFSPSPPVGGPVLPSGPLPSILGHREPLDAPSLACTPLRGSHHQRCFAEEREGGHIWQECSRDLGTSQPG